MNRLRLLFFAFFSIAMLSACPDWKSIGEGFGAIEIGGSSGSEEIPGEEIPGEEVKFRAKKFRAKKFRAKKFRAKKFRAKKFRAKKFRLLRIKSKFDCVLILPTLPEDCGKMILPTSPGWIFSTTHSEQRPAVA